MNTHATMQELAIATPAYLLALLDKALLLKIIWPSKSNKVAYENIHDEVMRRMAIKSRMRVEDIRIREANNANV